MAEDRISEKQEELGKTHWDLVATAEIKGKKNIHIKMKLEITLVQRHRNWQTSDYDLIKSSIIVRRFMSFERNYNRIRINCKKINYSFKSQEVSML